MVRVTTDAANAGGPRLRRLLEGDPRRFYYPFMLLLNVLFFGFFFVNFVADLVGDPLITF